MYKWYERYYNLFFFLWTLKKVDRWKVSMSVFSRWVSETHIMSTFGALTRIYLSQSQKRRVLLNVTHFIASLSETWCKRNSNCHFLLYETSIYRLLAWSIETFICYLLKILLYYINMEVMEWWQCTNHNLMVRSSLMHKYRLGNTESPTVVLIDMLRYWNRLAC